MPSLINETSSSFETQQTDIETGLDEILKIIDDAFEKNQNPKDVACEIKQTCDDKFGQHWHCIIGKSFGSKISHEYGSFLFGYNADDIAVMLFKTS